MKPRRTHHSKQRGARRQRTTMTTILLALAVCLTLIFAIGKGNRNIMAQPLQSVSASQKSYPYSQVSKELIGEGAFAYWIFQPQGETPATAPVTLFLHGWMAIDPYPYGGWIDHLAKSGHIVIYPVFQTSQKESAEAMEENAFEAIRQAIAYLDNTNLIRPNWSRLSIVGHSFGGGLSTLVAANAQSLGLPAPKVIMAVAPGWKSGGLPTQTLDQISPDSHLLIIEGADDELADSRQGANIYDATPQIPTDRKEFVLLETNDSDVPVDHSAPLAPMESYRNATLSRREVRRQRFGALVLGVLTGQSAGTTDYLDADGYWRILDQANQAATTSRAQPNQSVASSLSAQSDVASASSQASGKGSPDNPQRIVMEKP